MMLLHACVLALFGVSVQGYIWQNVQNPDGYSPDTVYFQSSTGTYGSCGYTDSAVGRFLRDTNRCYIPFESEEFEVVLPYDVLVREPFREFMIWTYIYSADEIRSEGVMVCDNCVGGSDMYVCASNEWGPGKLIVGSDNSVVCYVSYNGDEHSFTDGYVTLTTQIAAEYGLSEVNYYLDDVEILNDEPTTLAEVSVSNDSDQDQTVTRTLTYSKTTSNEWGNSYGFVLGVSMSVSAGIPLFGELGWEVSAEQSYDYSYGESYSETIESSTEATLIIPAGYSCKVTIVARELIADVPYDATTVVMYPDGTTFTEYITGVYNGLQINSDEVNYEPCIQIGF